MCLQQHKQRDKMASVLKRRLMAILVPGAGFFSRNAVVLSKGSESPPGHRLKRHGFSFHMSKKGFLLFTVGLVCPSRD